MNELNLVIYVKGKSSKEGLVWLLVAKVGRRRMTRKNEKTKFRLGNGEPL